ncbi:MAG: PEP-CTERM sorting domain-containing protein [Rhodospirillaceae bacterium]|nr:MAG: PEP-CTERM sorting domain-containing protein [Rhodospirillaceae bacterium]
MVLQTGDMLLLPEPGMLAIFGMGLLGRSVIRQKRA